MSNTLNIALVISGMVSSALYSAVGDVQKTLGKLDGVTKELTDRHQRLGKVMKSLGADAPQLRHMQDRYRQLGDAVELVGNKQKRLNDLIQQGAGIRARREGYRNELFETAGQAAAIGAPVIKSVQLAGSFQDLIRDISITGDFSAAEEAGLGKTIRDNARRFNQTQEDLATGIGVLVAGGISSAKELAAFAPVLAKAATATRAGVDELGSVFIALRDNLGISAKDSESALNMLAYAGKKGQFEIKDMARWLPNLAPQMAALGLSGKEAVAEIGAALQVARKGAGTNDEAANNFRNFLTKVTAPETLRTFQKAGIDLKGDLITLREQGMTPMQGMLHLITQYMGTKGPEAAGQFTKALEIKDDAEREAAIARLNEAYKLGELFQDMQAMNFIKPAIANAKEMADIKAGALAAGNADLLGGDLAKRMEGFNERWKGFTIRMKDLGISLGNALIPPLTSVVALVSPLVGLVGTLVNTFPRLTGALVGIVSGLLLGKAAVLGFLYLKTMMTGFFVSVQTASALASAKLAIFRVSTLLAGGAMRTFSLSFVSGMRAALVAVRSFSRALLTTPIGWIGLAVAGAALLIYKFWKPISGFFRGLWQGLKEGLKPLEPAFAVFKKFAPWIFPVLIPLRMVRTALGWVGRGIKALFGPIEDVGGRAEAMGKRFGAALAGIVNFATAIPARMFTAGANIVKSLWEGMKSLANKPVEAMKSIAGKIREYLPFSPAKVGPLRDIHRIKLIETIAGAMKPQPMVQAMKTATAATALALSLGAPAAAPSLPRLPALPPVPTAPGTIGGRADGAVRGTAAPSVVFAPNITITGGGQGGAPGGVKGQVEQALALSFEEFARLMDRYQKQQQRRSFA